MAEEKIARYVLGFAFSEDGKDVVLIQKRKPKWQAGKLNGVGGKIEPEEFSFEAMVREFEEETTVKTKVIDWRNYATMSGPNWSVDVFYTFTNKVYEARTNTQEQVGVYEVSSFMLNCVKCISNLKWLILMALNSKEDVSLDFTTIRYSS